MEGLCSGCKWWCENGDGSQMICDCTKIWEGDDDKSVPTTTSSSTNTQAEHGLNWTPIKKKVKRKLGSKFPDDDGDDVAPAIPWRDVEKRTWLKVVQTIKVNTINGKNIIVILKRRDGREIKAWTTSLVAINIIEKQSELVEGKNLFIKSLGMKKSERTKMEYHNFQLKLY